MVTKSNYISFLNSPELIHADSINQLEELQEKYPYCGDIQMLLTKGYHTVDSINYQNQLKNTAISIPNREALYDLIYKVKLKEEITKEEEVLVSEIDELASIKEQDIEVEEKEEEKVEKTSINEIVKTKEETNDKLEELILSHAIGSSYVLEEEVPNKKEEENKVEKVEQPIEEKKIKTTHHSFYSWLTPNEITEEEVKEEPQKNSINDLVEKFIQSKENEKIKRKEFFSPTNVAKLSVVETDDFVTETLANIYFEQHMYEKALRAYEKLILKNPEKKTYFASQIKKIKSLLE